MNKTILIISFIFTLFLASCNQTKNNVQINEDSKQVIKEEKVNQKIENTEDEYSKYQQKPNIELSNTSGELKIGSSVIIKKGFPSIFPSEFTTNDDEQTYVNSNVHNYFFYTSKLNKINTINNYKTKLLKNGWEEVSQLVVINQENPDIVPKIDEIKNNITFKKENKEVSIFLNDNIPENIEKLGIKGLYIEVYLNLKEVE